MDGTYMRYAPDANLPDVLAWRRAVEQSDELGGLDAPIADITDSSYLLTTAGPGRITRPPSRKPDPSIRQEALF
ncbi:hypothetical protein [Nonomuraea basaltis]|uniref:hypothetical protein n=1 Tax=Nonomuraea basaltis TaxID=2495887 RepID=UPI00110C405B|nr:hypothetical protein [Nonomuraea basaltis]TMR99578.1 hypothetical protein EJK15_07125 [Nonomuraea basaltis]